MSSASAYTRRYGFRGLAFAGLLVILVLAASLFLFNERQIPKLGPFLPSTPRLSQARQDVLSAASTLHAPHGFRNEDCSETVNRTGTWPFMGGRVRGYVGKTGILAPEYYDPNLNEMRNGLYSSWLKSYANGTRTGEGPVLPHSHCKIAVDHKYKYIWIRGFKVASSTMRGPLRNLCSTSQARSNSTNRKCIREIGQGGNFTNEDVQRWFKEYFVFGVARNPYARFASGEEMIGKMIEGKCGRPSFAETCQEPFLLVKICEQKHCCGSRHNYMHLGYTSDCLFDRSFNPVVDYIAEVENLDDDFSTIIEEINERRDPVLPPLNFTRGTQANKNRGRRLAEHSYAYDLYNTNKICLSSVYEFFRRDFELFGYQRLKELDQ